MNDVIHVPDQKRFELRDGDELAVLTYELRGTDPDDGAVVFLHTHVPKAMKGEGVGSRLAEAGVRWAVGQRRQVRPECPFVKGWLERHPEALTG